MNKRSIKLVCIFWMCIAMQLPLYGQTTGLLHKGYCELELGKDFWSVKHLLESKPSEGHEKTLQPDQLLYKVKLTEKKYHDILGVEVNTIEVKFEDKKIVELLILFDKTKKNIATLKEALKKEFGSFPCHLSGSDELFNCSLNPSGDPYKFQFYTYDQTGQFPVNGFLCIRFHRSGQLASE